MNMRAIIFVFALLLGIANTPYADLVVIGTADYENPLPGAHVNNNEPVTPGGHDFKLIYDTDKKITWLDYYIYQATQSQLRTWASGLKNQLVINLNEDVFRWEGDYWRLPETEDGSRELSYDGTTSIGYNITSSELGDLFYAELGNQGAYLPDGSPAGDYGLDNKGPFNNMWVHWSDPKDSWYWSNTSTTTNPDGPAFLFNFFNGRQATDRTQGGYNWGMRNGLAVCPGKVTFTTSVTAYGPILYSGFQDSPFADVDEFEYFFLEDFEDQSLNTPGVTSSRAYQTVTPGYGFEDSVDADDGILDGGCANCQSMYLEEVYLAPGWIIENSPRVVEFTFDENVLGTLPTHAGVVFTDGTPAHAVDMPVKVEFFAYDADGQRVSHVGPISWTAGTEPDDMFFGVERPAGIKRIKIVNWYRDYEIDHLQYGYEGVNLAPELESIGDQTIAEGELLEFTVNALDSGNSALLAFSADNLPEGSVFDASTATFAWTPTYDQAGIYDNLNFCVADSGVPKGEDCENVSITVENVNRAPVIDPVSPVTAQEYDQIEITISAADPDNDAVQISCSNLPEGAGFDPGSGVFHWIPSFDQAQEYSIIFQATDDGTPPLSVQMAVAMTIVDIPPKELSDELTNLIVAGLDLPAQAENSYLANLKKINDFIDEGKIGAAINQLDAFIKKVQMDTQKGTIHLQDSQVLLGMALEIKNQLEG